jgi:proteic killer suppression protein
VIRQVVISEGAKKQLRKVPMHIVDKLLGWIRLVEEHGLEEIRKISGYHDEPLKGDRKGQHSIRLSRAYRAIYAVVDSAASFVSVKEVHKHKY